MRKIQTFQIIEEMTEQPDGSVVIRFVLITPIENGSLDNKIYEQRKEITPLEMTENTSLNLYRIKANNAIGVFVEFYNEKFGK